MAQQMQPTAPYEANYSYQGMNNVNVINGSVPNIISEASGLMGNAQQQNAETQSQVSATSTTTTTMPHSQSPPAPPPPVGQQHGYPAYGGQYHGDPGPPQRPPPQQYQYNNHQGYGPDGGPVPSAQGSEYGEYTGSGRPPQVNRYGTYPRPILRPPTGPAFHPPPMNPDPPPMAQGRPPMGPGRPPMGLGRPLMPQGRPPMGPGRPPPSAAGSGYYSGSSEYSSDSDYPVARPPMHRKQGGFVGALKELMEHLSYADLVPIVGTIGTFAYHKLRSRNKRDNAQYQKPSWMNHVENAAFIYTAYDFVKGAGGSTSSNSQRPAQGPRPPGGGGGMNWTSILATAIGANRPQMYGGFHPYPQPDKGTLAMHKIISSLFKKVTSRDAAVDSNGPISLDDFDRSCAIDKRTAEYYHSLLFGPQADLSKATAQMLGGAAAIQALRSEPQVQEALKTAVKQGHANKIPKDLNHEHVVLGVAMSEADQLMQRKSTVVHLSPDDTLFNIARVAIASVIQIKMDEEKTMGMGSETLQGHQEDGNHQRRRKPHRRHSTAEQTPAEQGYLATTGQVSEAVSYNNPPNHEQYQHQQHQY
ncbi:hypothetical protein EC988_005679, partial [Linderina pennispora]